MIKQITQEHLAWWDNLPKLWQRIFVQILYHATPTQNVRHYWCYDEPPQDLPYAYYVDYHDLTSSFDLREADDLLRLFQTQAIVYHVDVCSPAYHCVKRIPPLHYFEDLHLLVLSDNCVHDISGLKGLKNLEVLSLDDNTLLADISPLAELTSLKELNLSSNRIRDVSPLQNLLNLKDLQLWDNDILDISPLQNLTQLQELSLFNNPILDIRPLANLKQLKDLDMGNEDFYFDDTHFAYLQSQLPDCKIELEKMLKPDTDEHFLNRVMWGNYYCRENEDVLGRFEQISAKQDAHLNALLSQAQAAYALRNLHEQAKESEYQQLPALADINRALFPTWADELLHELTVLANDERYHNKKYFNKEDILAKIKQIDEKQLGLFLAILRDLDLIANVKLWR